MWFLPSTSLAVFRHVASSCVFGLGLTLNLVEKGITVTSSMVVGTMMVVGMALAVSSVVN